MYTKIEARWNNPDTSELRKLGLDTKGDDYIIKEVWVDLSKVSFIDEYCCLQFSGAEGDLLITNVKYKDVERVFINVK